MNHAICLRLAVALYLLGIATEATEPPTLRLTSVRFASAAGRHHLEFEVANPNVRQPLPYLGYLADSFDPPLKPANIAPWYVIETKVGSEWMNQGPIFCKTGVGSVALKPMSRSIFTVYTSDAGNWTALRIGFRWAKNANLGAKREWQTVWTQPLSKQAIATEAR